MTRKPVTHKPPVNGGEGKQRSVAYKIRIILYWLTTGFIAYELILGAFWDFNILNKSFVYGVMKQLGYPIYFAYIMGVWKIPGAIILVMPGFLKLKEWAYAGAFFMYTGAATSHFISGDTKGAVIPLIFALIEMTSYVLRPPTRRLSGEPARV